MPNYLAVAMAALSLASLKANSYNITGIDDDTVAGKELARWATTIGIKPEKIFDDGTMWIREEFRWQAYVRCHTQGNAPDRFIFTSFIRGKPTNKNNAEVAALMNQLNDDYNVCSFYIDSDGDLVMQFNLCFDDTLSPALFRKFIQHIEDCRRLIIAKEAAKLKLYFN